MGNAYKTIDQKTWKRKDYCEVYRRAALPQYCVSFELDVTNFKARVKERGLSYTFAFIFAVTTCASEIEEFRYRFLNGEVVLYESVDTSFAYLDGETELFKVVHAPMRDTMEDYVKQAASAAKNQTANFTGPVENDVYQFSALPWVRFTHISHTDFGNPEKAQPIFAWGKFYEKDGRWAMPFSVQAHHAFVDGVHIGMLAEKLQKYLDGI